MICRCGKTYGDTYESRMKAVYVGGTDGLFRPIFCSWECNERFSSAGGFFCKGPAHPATGHVYSPSCIACERCYREFLPWLKGRLHHNPIALAATVPPGRVIVGEWTADDEARAALRRSKRKR